MALAALGGRCRRCGGEARKATPDGGGISSLCWECTRIVNAEQAAPPIPLPTREERLALDERYAHAKMPTPIR
jgi:hypothetical protein